MSSVSRLDIWVSFAVFSSVVAIGGWAWTPPEPGWRSAASSARPSSTMDSGK